MAWTNYSDALTKIRNAIDARISGGAVESWTTPDGTNISTCPLETLFRLEERLVARAREESSISAFRLTRLRPTL